MNGRDLEREIAETEHGLNESRDELDRMLEAVGVDPTAFSRLAKDPPPLTPEQRRACEEIEAALDLPAAPPPHHEARGIRI